jgi:signal transduction histidine kinase
MGSRGRSIRLRIYFLVAIPLLTMVGLLTYVVTTSVHNAINLDRAPDLIKATSEPAALFTTYLQAERLGAVVYVFEPTEANLQAYQADIAATTAAEKPFVDAMDSPATKGAETATSAQGISDVIAGLPKLTTLREGVEARMIAPGKPMTALDALGAYSQGIATEPQLFLDEADSLTNATAASQALGLIGTVSAHEALSQEDALLSGMLAADKASPADRAAFTEIVATREADLQDADYLFTPANLQIFEASLAGTGTQQQQLTLIEQEVAGGVPMSRLGITTTQWQALAGTLLSDYYNGGINAAGAQLTVDHQISHVAWVRVAVTSGIALAGLLLTILMTTLVGRSIIRRLRGLETNALTLAEQQLPSVVSRLRRGEDVDVATEAPPLRVGGDEIGRVGQAFDLVRQTAIRSAVEEARLRRGLNDVFRSLARRSQSLLHRQLTLLDQMERRASDPEALDDLFRLDHLTTRMRRHAEGLVILAGAPPGRGWSSPVRMVDVMRGAIAEVEDYARVSVATRSQAALSGSAVADVIHLLAELIENATTLSPPYTSVRVSGDIVANGFAIEVEDRGLGMSSQRLAELNDRLATPPEFNPSDSEQLGLFVVSQLARRHGIKVTLKASPYGGTEAVVLVPRHLVVADEAFRASLPGEQAPAITLGPSATNGNHFSAGELPGGSAGGDLAGAGAGSDGGSDGGSGFGPGLGSGAGSGGFAGRPRISGPLRRAQGSVPDGTPQGGHHAGNGNGVRLGNGSASPGSQPTPADGFAAADGAPPAARGGGTNPFGAVPFSPDPFGADPFSADPFSADPFAAEPSKADPFGADPFGANPFAAEPFAAEPSAADPFGADPFGADSFGADSFGTDAGELPRRNRRSGAGQPPAGQRPAGRSPAGRPGGGARPDAAGQPAGGADAPIFDVFSAQQSDDPAAAGPFPTSPFDTGSGPYSSPFGDQSPPFPAWPGTTPAAQESSAPPATPMTPVATTGGAQASRPPWELPSDSAPQPVLPADTSAAAPPPDGVGQSDGDFRGLPRRVKQASIAPQLRGDPASRAPRTAGGNGGPAVAGPSPDEIRATMSALQRGLQEGRSQRSAGGEPPWEQEAESGSDGT